MPWMETRVSDQRMKFIAQHELEDESMAALCRAYGIARKTGYKWLARWLADGPMGLTDRSRAPHHHPNQVPAWQVEAILAMRDRYGWGPRKLRVLLAREHPQGHWPAISTLQQILTDHARVVPRRPRHRVPPHSRPLAHANASNAVWCCDFKGWFRTADGSRCDPLTLTDAFSRYLLGCQGLGATGYEHVRPVFERTFRQFGLPVAIRSDNGSPFASRAVAGLSRLSLWWLKLGIVHERIQPGQPQQNGRHERMHLSLKQATASPPAGTLRAQQQRFDAWGAEFNEVRPHEALGMATPASVYEPSGRAYPSREPELTYPDGWSVRRVQKRGEFYWGGAVELSEVLAGEPIGLEPLDGRYWRTYAGPLWLGVFDSHLRRMLSPSQLRRRQDLAPPATSSPALAMGQANPPRDPQDPPSAALQDDPAEHENVLPMCPV